MVEMTNSYKTRDGREVKLLTVSRNGPLSVVALVQDLEIITYLGDGRLLKDIETPADLIRCPNIYEQVMRFHSVAGPVSIKVIFEDNVAVRSEVMKEE